MRTSSKRTPVAVLRKIIGLKSREFAEMARLSLSAVEKLESGRLRISEAVAQRISFETGVDAHWLLDGDPQMPPFLAITAREYLSAQLGEDYQQVLYSKEVFDRIRAARLAKKSPIPEGEHTGEEQIICLLYQFLCSYSSARSNGEEGMILHRLHSIGGDIAKEFGFSHDDSAFELVLEAGRCLPELANHLNCDPKDLSDLACAPRKAEPIKFLQFRRRVAKAIRAINETRKVGPRPNVKTRPVSSKEGINAQLDAPAPHPLTEDEIRALFAPVRRRMEAKGYSEDQIRSRLDGFRKRQRAAEANISPSSV
jgi:transcriptional regulator with XRE-family HTH domain